MSSPGHAIFYDLYKEQKLNPIHAYTRNGGYEGQAILKLIKLPFIIFQKQKQSCVDINTNISYDQSYWHYSLAFESAVEGILNNNRFNLERIVRSNYNTFDITSVRVANWFAAQHFETWMVVPEMEPQSDFTVLCDGLGYQISVNDKHFWLRDEINSTINALNKAIPYDTMKGHVYQFKENTIETVLVEKEFNCKITYKETDDHNLEIYVPLNIIYMAFLWENICTLHKDYDAKAIPENSWVSNMITKLKGFGHGNNSTS